jgi:ATP-dependent Clp protease ATP-binding subunit ClpA
MTLAKEEAQRFNHNYIGTEHLLLGLVREGEGVAAQVLSNLGVELTKVRSAVEFIIGRGERQVFGEIGLTPRAKKIVSLARDEARRLRHDYVGTEHLLLGLIREGEGIACGVLESLGVNVERVRTETLKVLVGSAPAQPEPAEPGHEATASSGESGTLHKVRWEYLLVQTTRSDDGTVRVHSVNGQDDPRFAANETPIYEALRVLGEDGWELMGIDSPGEPEAAGLYVFKRPER